jgi:CHASE2 domain-containing sensor protein
MRQALSRHRERRHWRENSLSAVTIVGGLVAFVSGLVTSTHLLAVCVGLTTFLFGLYSQLVSVTTAERWVNVIGIGLAFVGLGLGLSHGGFTI